VQNRVSGCNNRHFLHWGATRYRRCTGNGAFHGSRAVEGHLSTSEEQRLRSLSLWWDGLQGPFAARPALQRDIDIDVAVVGAGYTGLWATYYLLRAAPRTRVAVLEKEVAGFGASGRNGGWCSALFPVSISRLAREHGTGAARAMRRAMNETVDEVGRAAALAGIDCSFAKGGTVVVARNSAQMQRAQAAVADSRALGLDADDLQWLGRSEAEKLVRAPGLLGATYTPHCAALDPARLARGLAKAVEEMGATIYEHTPVYEIQPGERPKRPVLRANGASVRADVVVRAVEAWTATLPGHHRDLIPVYSLMIATEPLPHEFWENAGLSRRETFSDHRHLIIYGQRTADGRIAFGGRGAPYHFGSTVRTSYDTGRRVHQSLRQILAELFPAVRDFAVTHAWGGPLGVPRDWFSSVGLDRVPGTAWAGGYVGDGVATSNLAGRTLADLVLGQDSDLVHLPWVAHRSPRWEPEPLRWLAVNAALGATKLADRSEQRRSTPSPLADVLGRFLGR
jgi:glycine/D-amino acid oxidase-like deaminating enzyme